jgi:hypothetical protein
MNSDASIGDIVFSSVIALWFFVSITAWIYWLHNPAGYERLTNSSSRKWLVYICYAGTFFFGFWVVYLGCRTILSFIPASWTIRVEDGELVSFASAISAVVVSAGTQTAPVKGTSNCTT